MAVWFGKLGGGGGGGKIFSLLYEKGIFLIQREEETRGKRGCFFYSRREEKGREKISRKGKRESKSPIL